jgi:hypothetical protein
MELLASLLEMIMAWQTKGLTFRREYAQAGLVAGRHWVPHSMSSSSQDRSPRDMRASSDRLGSEPSRRPETSANADGSSRNTTWSAACACTNITILISAYI